MEPLPGAVRDIEPAMVLLRDAVHHREAHAAALVHCLWLLKNGSKIRARVASSIPVPCRKAKQTYLPGPLQERAADRLAVGCKRVVKRSASLHRGIASRAFVTRFTMNLFHAGWIRVNRRKAIAALPTELNVVTQ